MFIRASGSVWVRVRNTTIKSRNMAPILRLIGRMQRTTLVYSTDFRLNHWPKPAQSAPDPQKCFFAKIILRSNLLEKLFHLVKSLIFYGSSKYVKYVKMPSFWFPTEVKQGMGSWLKRDEFVVSVFRSIHAAVIKNSSSQHSQQRPKNGEIFFQSKCSYLDMLVSLLVQFFERVIWAVKVTL